MHVIDTHAHWYPQEFVSLLEREAAANGAEMSRNAKGNPVFALPGMSQVSAMKPSMIDLDLMLKAMDERRIDAYALSLTNPMVYWAPPAFGLKLSRTWNDASAAAHIKHPQRFIGTFPWLIGRFDRGVEVRQELKHMKQPPSAYLRRFYYDTISHHPGIMRALIDLVGADRVLIGSDYNFDVGYERPVEFVDRIPGLTARERELIVGENAARVLKL